MFGVTLLHNLYTIPINVTEAMASAFEFLNNSSGAVTDVTLRCGDSVFTANREELAAKAEYFCALLSEDWDRGESEEHMAWRKSPGKGCTQDFPLLPL